MAQFKLINGERVPFTIEEQAQRDKDKAEWLSTKYLIEREQDAQMPSDRERLDALWLLARGDNSKFNDCEARIAAIISKYPVPL